MKDKPIKTLSFSVKFEMYFKRKSQTWKTKRLLMDEIKMEKMWKNYF